MRRSPWISVSFRHPARADGEARGVCVSWFAPVSAALRICAIPVNPIQSHSIPLKPAQTCASPANPASLRNPGPRACASLRRLAQTCAQYAKSEQQCLPESPRVCRICVVRKPAETTRRLGNVRKPVLRKFAWSRGCVGCALCQSLRRFAYAMPASHSLP